VTFLGNGVQTLREKVLNYFFYNSSFSNLRVMASFRRRLLLKVVMNSGLEDDKNKEQPINQFAVHNLTGLVFFTYILDENLYVYSYLLRRLIKKIRIYDPSLKALGKNQKFTKKKFRKKNHFPLKNIFPLKKKIF